MGIRQEMSGSSGKETTRLAWIAVAVFLVTLLPYFVPVLDADTMAEYGDTWVDIPFIALIIFLIVFRRPAATSNRERGFWTALAAGFGCWFVGRVAWGVLFDVGLPIDLIADFLYMLLYVGILVALELDPGRRAPTAFERRLRRYSIGGGVVLLVAGYVYFLLVPALLTPESYKSWEPAVVGTVIFDGYVTIQLLLRIRSAEIEHWRRVYTWMAAAFGAWVVTDLLDMISLYVTVPVLEPGSIHDVLWYMPYALFVVSLLVGRQIHEDETPEAEVEVSGPMAGPPLVAYACTLMLIHLLLDVTGLLDTHLHTARGIIVVVETLILAGIVFVVQRLVMQENRRLHDGLEDVSSALVTANRSLEFRVQGRTLEVEESNRRLREAEARNLALIHAVPDALIVVDGDGMVREVLPSRAGAETLDLPSFLGHRLSDRLPEEVRGELEQALDRIRRGHGPQSVAMVVANGDGRRHFELRGGRCGDEEILVLVQDVTERRDFESALQQSQRLESLGILAGGIAHDFNNLLVSILGNAQLAREGLAAGTETPATLAAIEDGALRAAKLTGTLLAYAGEAHIERQPLDLTRVFGGTDTLLATAVPKRTRFTLDVGREPLWIDGNEAQVTQILLNLVRNAAESLSDNAGSISVDLRRCRLGETDLASQVPGTKHRPGDHVRLRVQDTGCGMDEESQQRIFDPFFTSKGAGRGLGLAAVLGIVNHHDGVLTLESQPGRGTTFSVYFPARSAPHTEAAAPSATARMHATGTILVADDEEGVRTLITTYLKSLGLTTLVAVNGAQAVELAQANRGNLAAILMDYAMPEMNGAEAFRLIREDDPEVPVIMLSGYGERKALGALADEQRTEFLQKPFQLAQLAAALREPLGLPE